MSWLGDYVEKTRHQESPEQFHIWTGISIIAAILGRKVWLARRSGGVTYYSVYPGQIMVVLTAGSGLVRKTTAIMPADFFVRKMGKHIIQGKSSVEAFLTQLDPQKGGDPNAVLIEGELTNFVSKANYMDPIVDVLMALADGRDVYDYTTLSKGKITIPKPSLTLLSCTTPESLGNRLPPSATGAGLMSRIIFVYAKETDRVADLSDVEDDDLNEEEISAVKAVDERLMDGLNKINSMAGPFTYSKEGRKWFQDYYKKWRKSPSGQGEGYPARKIDHLLRVAICISASQNQSMVLTEQSLNAARVLLDSTEKDFDKAFAYIGTSYTKDRQRIVEFISVKGGKASSHEIYAALYVYFKDLDTLKRTLSLLETAGVIKSLWDNSKHPAVQYWSLVSISLP